MWPESGLFIRIRAPYFSCPPAALTPPRNFLPRCTPAPKLPHDPVRALEAEHGRLGIRVDPATTTPHCNGGRFDVGWAIHTLRRP